MVKRKCQLGLARGDMLGWQAGKMGVEGFGMGVGFVYGVREGGYAGTCTEYNTIHMCSCEFIVRMNICSDLACACYLHNQPNTI